MKTLAVAVASGAFLVSTGLAENLLDNASFEFPPVSKRTLTTQGGDPSSTEEKTSWTSLIVPRPSKDDGQLTAGLTNEIARTGKQSVFVDFSKYTKTGTRVLLSADMIPIKADSPYRISFWGRLDKERPLTMDERRPHALVSVEYFAADMETQIGDTEYRTQMIPGNIVPGLGVRLLFSATKWAEYYAELKSPLEAVFMKLAIAVEAPRIAGETDGILYIDDAAIEGERGVPPPEIDEEDEAEAAGKPAPGTPAPAKPTAK